MDRDAQIRHLEAIQDAIKRLIGGAMRIRNLIRRVSACIALFGTLIMPAFAQPQDSKTVKKPAFQYAPDLTGSISLDAFRRHPNSAAVAVLRFAASSRIASLPMENIPQIAAAGPALAAVGPVPMGAAFPSGGGGALPPWVRTPAPPGLRLTEPSRMAVENSNWTEAKRLHDALQGARLDDQTRRALELPWPWLSTKQQEIFSEGAVLDAEWDAIFPGIRDAVNEFVDGYWTLKKDVDALQGDFEQYKTYCSRGVPPEEIDSATRECNEMRSGLDGRQQVLVQRETNLKSALDTLVGVPINNLAAKTMPYLQKVAHWNGKVLEYNKSASEALTNARKPDIKFIDRLVKKYKLDPCQRRVLHREITGQNYSDEEIEEIARELSATGRGRCRPGQEP